QSTCRKGMRDSHDSNAVASRGRGKTTDCLVECNMGNIAMGINACDCAVGGNTRLSSSVDSSGAEPVKVVKEVRQSDSRFSLRFSAGSCLGKSGGGRCISASLLGGMAAYSFELVDATLHVSTSFQ